MSRQEMVEECKRLTLIIKTTKSEKLKRDSQKYLKRLQKRLLYE